MIELMNAYNYAYLFFYSCWVLCVVSDLHTYIIGT